MAVHIPATIVHRKVQVDGLDIFYRETRPQAGAGEAPVVLLLHGFPSASHQYRRLMETLGNDFRMIAPDHPGSGHSSAPKSANQGGTFTYSFDTLSEVMEGFVDALGLKRFMLYVFDFGAPVGLRLASRRPELVAGLIVQNGNAYDEGLSPVMHGLIPLTPDTEGAKEELEKQLTLGVTRSQYEGGTTDPSLVAPDGWILDQYFLDQPAQRQAQVDLLFDYKSNPPRYPEWQRWLREAAPPVLITWGRNDPFFSEAGARAYLRDAPKAELHLFDTGHFALEECLPQIAPLIGDFVKRRWR
ncbi:alpha/beta hydrolase [Rhizobium sp. BK251]|uniref:alpha/beta fold hydrolase n=1 Tax=Rhizobium sp. BK251 TaxID=2512125 RepID=UPI0010478D04|nr:alpha/beta hydrolase [Rhizobium sp. BK251]TCL76211.1 pimeloyl-ACP methyl ester carboxylesterase [Rhizobium sp. BK251]